MRALILASMLLIVAPNTYAQDWALAAEKVAAASVYLEIPDSGCTGFLIDAERDHILTAAHCWVEKELYADSLPVAVIFKDVRRDLMVLKVAGISEGREALVLAAEDPKLGESVASFGWGYALEEPMFRVAVVSATELRIDGGGPYIALDAAFVPGMSGGPGVNAAGELVMIVQRASDRVGVGVGVKTIRGRVKKFFAK